MDRRTFLCSVASTALVHVPQSISSYTYDWGSRPSFTDDPAFIGKSLPYGPGNVVTLNGKNISDLYIVRLRTGVNGYVEFQVRDEDGRPQESLYDQWNKVYIAYKDAKKYKWQQYDPKRVDREGNFLPRFIETGETLTETYVGRVEYRWDEEIDRRWREAGSPTRPLGRNEVLMLDEPL